MDRATITLKIKSKKDKMKIYCALFGCSVARETVYDKLFRIKGTFLIFIFAFNKSLGWSI